MGGHYKRSMAAAIQIGLGNCGGIVASNVFLSAQAPTYKTGFGTALAFLIVLCGGMAIALFFGLKAENRKRERGGRDYRFTEEAADLDNMGDDHPDFRFTTWMNSVGCQTKNIHDGTGWLWSARLSSSSVFSGMPCMIGKASLIYHSILSHFGVRFRTESKEGSLGRS
jgi:hypothetical protein